MLDSSFFYFYLRHTCCRHFAYDPMDSPQTDHLTPSTGAVPGPAGSTPAGELPGAVIEWERPADAAPLKPISIRLGREELRLLTEMASCYSTRLSPLASRLLVAQLKLAKYCGAVEEQRAAEAARQAEQTQRGGPSLEQLAAEQP